MSTYKFKLSKRHIVSQDDSSVWSPVEDSTIDSTQLQDIAVKLYLDDVLKHTVTVTDSGGTLEFTQNIAQGDHTIRIVCANDPIQHTDVCVDQLLIDDVETVTTQYDYNKRVLDNDSTLVQLCAYPNAQPFKHIWYGNTIANDSTFNLEGPFYRPTIVAAHQGEWVWDFNKTASGVIWFQDRGDINDILYDSTAQHTYYLCADTATQDDIQSMDLGDSSSIPTATPNKFLGVGTYNIDASGDLDYVSDSIDETPSSSTMVIYTLNDYTVYDACYKWHQSNTVTAITVT